MKSDHDGILQRLRTYMSVSGFTQARVASAASIGESTLSQLLSSTYPSDPTNHIRKLAAWLDLQDRKAERPKVAFIDTATSRSICRAIECAQEGEDIAVIVGEAGSGKTCTARRYCETSLQGVYVEMGAVANRSVVLRTIANALDLPTPKHSNEIAEAIVERLRDTGKVLVVDEADQLSYSTLNTLRRISDQAHCGLVFIGLPGFAHAIKHRVQDFNQISSRVGLLLRVPGLSREDAAEIVKSAGVMVSKEALVALVDLAAGSLRRFVKLLQNALRVLKINNLVEIDSRVVEAAESVSMR